VKTFIEDESLPGLDGFIEEYGRLCQTRPRSSHPPAPAEAARKFSKLFVSHVLGEIAKARP
jgi:hypothetical protein